MAISTKAELRTAVTDWLLRVGDTRFAARFDNLCTMAEATLNKTLRCIEMQAQETVITVAGTQTLAWPSGFLENVSLVSLDYQAPPIDQMEGSALDLDFAGVAAGRPQAFSAWGGLFTFGPTPDAAYNLRSRFYKQITALAGDGSNNAVLLAHPDIYMNAVLMEAAPTLRDQDAVLMWRESLETRVALANEAAQGTIIAHGRARRAYGRGV